MVSSHLVFSEWKQIFQNAMTTTAVVYQLVHHSVILELNLPSYRLEVAHQRQTSD
ncbi:MAG: ATP-binding protein [Rhodothermaceae bacterium]|nr:ATP-binding protein [Rhodothermaceae bacterium]MXW32234.1 ATP-binding protein [Rhodothermaceae bacterium]MXZ17144.1 ATP-binding protein [Rhodothermaceae bacterium]MYC05340.1 ATP-binding protein [Rhodothermaceae bacterium]MYE64259.1 ATP-binding protein [Rhodothermaceae bacterium]